MTSRVSLLLLLVCALCAPGAAQQIWKVNCAGGPGVDFTDLPPAVAAAAPGDEIWVYWGPLTVCPPTFSNYSAAVINKPLRIVGFALGSNPSPDPSSAGFKGLFVIVGIPAGQQVLLSNVSLVYIPQSASPSGIVAVDCAGDVVLEDISYEGGGRPNSYMHFERCHNVVLRACEFYLSGSPIRVIDSTMLMTTTAVYHRSPDGGYGSVSSYVPTTEGIRLTNSTVTIVNSFVWGNRRYSNVEINWINRPAAVIESGTLRLGPFSTLLGGLQSQWPYQAYGYEIIGPGTVEKDYRATITLPVQPPNLPVLVDRPAAFHDWLVANQPFHVSVAGPPNGFALMAIGDMTPFPQVTPFGTLALDPLTITTVGFAALPPPNGWYEWTSFCPSSAAIAHAFAFQAMTIAPNGTLSLTVPSPFTVGWEHGRIP